MMTKKTKTKGLLFALWISGIAVFFGVYVSHGIQIDHCPAMVCGLVNHVGFWGPVLFVTLFVLRTLTFFSMTVFTVAAGILFPPLAAMLYVILSANLSALLAFFVGRYFGRDVFARAGHKLKYFPRGALFHKNGFMTVLVMYLLFFPFDWVGYVAGAYNTRVRDMFLGALLGTLPGIIAFVSLGGALRDPLRALPLFVGFFLLGIVIAHILKKTSLGKSLAAQER